MHNYLCFHPSNPHFSTLIVPFSVSRRELVVAAEPLFVYLFVTWHLTSWQWSRVPKWRADVVTNLWGGTWPGPNQECLNEFPPQRDTQIRSLCTSLDNQVSFTLNWNVRYLHVVYTYALCSFSAFFLSFLFCKCCSCCKTMHWVHFQRLSTERVHDSLPPTGLITF